MWRTGLTVGAGWVVALGALVYAVSALGLDVLGARAHLLARVRNSRRLRTPPPS